ncbi:MAG: hypothetical protein IKW67_00395 [Alphaproteobacteria bacterium]|nr:hypothetical protein [Alphaproteobacteria bacterium]
MKKLKQGHIVHTRGQKVAGWIALIMLFICGMMVGVAINKKQTGVVVDSDVIQMSDLNCSRIEEQMAKSSTTAEKLAELKDIYSEYCAGRKVEKSKEQPKSEPENVENIKPKSTCERIEEMLLMSLPAVHGPYNNREYIKRAQIYAQISERGCAENSQKYADMAKQELDVVRAIQDDMFYEESEIENIVETYKRLEMQEAAAEVFENIKKLTDPTIDFILQIEKIINE